MPSCRRLGAKETWRELRCVSHVRCELNQCVHVQLGRPAKERSGHRRELERAHAAFADVTQSLDGVEAVGTATFCCEPRIDQCVAESVRQGVRCQNRAKPWNDTVASDGNWYTRVASGITKGRVGFHS